MKNLELKMQIILVESEEGEHPCHDKTITNVCCRRVIVGNLRSLVPDDTLQSILAHEINNAKDYLALEFNRQTPWPLTEEMETKEDRIKSDLKALFPNVHFLSYFSGKTYVVSQLMIIDAPFADAVTIPHPAAPAQTLTTCFPGTFVKLDAGFWTYGYSSMGYYRGICSPQEPPIDVTMLYKYFSARGIPFEIALHQLSDLPAPIEDEGNEESE